MPHCMYLILRLTFFFVCASMHLFVCEHVCAHEWRPEVNTTRPSQSLSTFSFGTAPLNGVCQFA